MTAIAEIMAKIGAVESMIAIVSQTPEGPMKTMQMEMLTKQKKALEAELAVAQQEEAAQQEQEAAAASAAGR